MTAFTILYLRYNGLKDCPGESRRPDCSACFISFQMLENVPDAVAVASDHIEEDVGHAEESITLYMGHMYRDVSQDRRIAEVMDGIKQLEGGKKEDIIIEYKMKFEHLRFREMRAAFYGKRDMYWHGVVFNLQSTQVGEFTLNTGE